MNINPLDQILDQLSELLRRTEEEIQNPSDKKPPTDLLKQFEQLEQKVQLFEKLHKSLLSASKVDKEQIEKIIEHTPPTTLLKDRLVLDRLKKIKTEIDSLRTLFYNTYIKAKKEGKQQSVERKKKFRGLGEGEKWKKL